MCASAHDLLLMRQYKAPDLRVRDLAVAPIAKDARARALTKRACPDGDSESFPLKRRRRAHLNKATDDGAQACESRSSAVWPVFSNKWPSVVNQKAEENFEVGNIWLPKQDSNSGPFG